MKKVNLIKNFPYENIRDQQKEILNKLQENWDRYRYFVIEAPTGVGKSAIAKAICNSVSKSFLITATKQLQDQYIKDFPDDTIKSIKGKANYQCSCNERLNCESGPCIVNKELMKECKFDRTCHYYRDRDDAINANTCLTSYQYFLRAMDCAGFWKKRDALIFDECHLLEQQITQWATIILSPRELNEKYNIFEGVELREFVILSTPPETGGYEDNKLWLKKIWDLIVKKRFKLYEEIKDSLDGRDPDSLTEDELDELQVTHKGYYEMDKFYKRLDIYFKLQDKSDWIIEPEKDGLILTPINVAPLFEFYADLWGKDHVIFMSATILDVNGFCKELGLPKDKTAIIRMESNFDPKKSPVIFYPTGSMNYENLDSTIPKIIKNVEELLNKHPNEKGIIHTGNYRIAKAICDNVNNHRLIMKDEDSNNEKLLRRHFKSKEPTVLVSPSLTTGADLKDDLSRFQIIIKLPWPNLQDKRVKKKIEQNGNWYAAEMFKTLIQAAGRSTRSEDDWSITYVLDSSFYHWVYKFKHWFNKYFLKRIIWKKDDYKPETGE